MITFVQGLVAEKEPTRAVIDVQGIGYELFIPVSTYEKIPAVGAACKLLTYMHVREDIMQLFGFVSAEERSFFLLLISVSGIGPKSGISMMSGIAIRDFKAAVLNEDVQLLTAIPGIGKKTAQRIVVELKDKITKMGDVASTAKLSTSSANLQVADEALMALISLGYSKPVAEKAIARLLREAGDKPFALQDMIKQALRLASTGA
ncbi:MAG TPA: Holliday junction branch migration protein RuvA [bacterium]|nr:Holliday junction branch migration protein RuvA [bacterium]